MKSKYVTNQTHKLKSHENCASIQQIQHFSIESFVLKLATLILDKRKKPIQVRLRISYVRNVRCVQHSMHISHNTEMFLTH